LFLQKKRGKDMKVNKENDGVRKEASFISFSGEDSNTSNAFTVSITTCLFNFSVFISQVFH
jgi:hypothetical protein